MSLAALAAFGNLHRPDGVRDVDGLVRRGLLSRRENPQNRRALLLALTLRRGARRRRQATWRSRRWASSWLQAVPEEHRQILHESLATIFEAATEYLPEPDAHGTPRRRRAAVCTQQRQAREEITMKCTKRWRWPLALIAVVSLAAGRHVAAAEAVAATSASATNCAPLTATQPLKLGVNPGAQDLVTFVMQEQRFAEKHQLDVGDQLVPEPGSAARRDRAEDRRRRVRRAHRDGGRPSAGTGTMFFDVLTSPSNVIITRNDSDLRTLADVQGAEARGVRRPFQRHLRDQLDRGEGEVRH